MPVPLALLRTYSDAFLAASIGLALTLLASFNIQQQLESNFLLEFRWAALDRIHALELVVDNGLDAVTEMENFIGASDSLAPEEFQAFAAFLLKRHPYLHAMQWIPEHPDARPVLHGVTTMGSDPMVGRDMRRDPLFAPLFEQAARTGRMAVSDRIHLPVAEGQEIFVFVAVQPLFHATDRGLAGFVAGIFRIDDLLHAAIGMLEPRGVEVWIRDESAAAAERFLAFYPSRLSRKAREVRVSFFAEPPMPNEAEQAVMTRAIPVADRNWSVTCVAIHQFRSAEAFREGHWFVLVGGGLFTLLLALYLVKGRWELDKQIGLERHIRDREELFRQMTETVNEVFWAAAPGGGELEYISPAWSRMSGAAPGQTGEGLLQSFHPEDRALLKQSLAQAGVKESFSVILRLLHHDGLPRWVRACGFPVWRENGSLRRVVGFFEEITDRKMAEDALKDSEAKLRTLFNHSPDILVTVDRTGRILLMNRPLPCVPDDEDCHRDSELLIPMPYRETYLQALARVFGGGEIEHFQYAGENATWWEIRMVPIVQACQVVVVLVILSDVTENRKWQWQAMRSARLASIGVLAAGVAHEINNPNHAILMNGGLIQRIWREALPILVEYQRENGDFTLGGLDFAEARETVVKGMEEIIANAKRIQKIVENLKYLGKQDRGDLDEQVEIPKVLKTVHSILDSKIRKFTDTFHLDLAEDLPRVRGNVQQLEQVLINVLLNALESLPGRQAAVRISARCNAEKDWVEVVVQDQGTGIAEEDLHRLTEPFFTTKSDRGGSGLGLSISSSILEKHGGSFRFDSRPGSGTTVTIGLPAAGAIRA